MTSTTTTTSPTAPMTFYDIALAPSVIQNACSPNPWKTRYALNFKKTPYQTTWVPLPDIPTVRGALNIPASRTFADGTPYHTLPVLSDPATGRIVGDSFEIAQYLQETYPWSGAGDLLPAQDLGFEFAKDEGLYAPVAEAQTAAAKGGTSAAYVKFNTSVDSVFSAHAQLMVQGFPFDPATAEASKAEFSRRMGGVTWDDLVVSGDKRRELLGSFEKALGGLARLFGRDDRGPFALGTRASYADFIVGGVVADESAHVAGRGVGSSDGVAWGGVWTVAGGAGGVCADGLVPAYGLSVKYMRLD